MSLMSFMAASSGGGIKSVQRGESSLGSIVNQGTTVTIAAVDPAKTMIFITGMRMEYGDRTLYVHPCVYSTVLLQSAAGTGGSTVYSLRFQRGSPSFSGGAAMETGVVYVSWQVVEFK